MDAEKKFIGGYVDEKLKADLERIAKADGRSVSNMIEKILTEGVKHLAKKKTKQAA